MNNMIISTEGSLKGYKVAQLVSSIIYILLGFFAFCLGLAINSVTSNPAYVMLIIIGILSVVLGFVTLIISTARSRTYINIYSDKVDGVGMQGSSVVSFNLQYSQINSISTEKDWIHVHTTIGTFKILTRRELSNQVLNYYNSNICASPRVMYK